MTSPAIQPRRAKKGPAGRKSPGGYLWRQKPASTFQFLAFAEFHGIGWIYRIAIHLNAGYLAILINEEGHTAADAPLFVVQAIFTGHITAQIAQQGEGNVDLLFPGLIAEGAVHAYTQHLGVC